MGDAHFETIPSSPSKESKSIFKSEDIKFCEDILPTRKQELVRSKQLLNGIGSLIQEHEEGQRKTPVAAVIRNRGRDPTRNPGRGLVASLQAVYEPPATTVISGKCWLGAKLSSSSPFSASSPSRMLARPWQKGLYGSETASNNPPLLPKPTHLVVCGNQAPAEYLSSSRSLSASGRAPSCLLSNKTPLVNGVVKATRVAPALTEVNHLSTNKTSKFAPLAWPTDSLKKLASEGAEVDMVEDRRTRNAPASPLNNVNALDSNINSKMKTSAKGTALPKGMANFRDHIEDEELQYGPGIVNKLKSRYLSRTLRERPLGEPRRSSLRRAASLEDWLDKDISSSSSPIVSPRLSTSTPRSDETNDANAVTIRSVSGRYERPASLNLAAAPISSTVVEASNSRSPSSSNSTSTVVKPTRSMSKTRSVDSFTKTAWRSVSISDLIISPPIVKPAVPATNLVSHDATLASPKTPVHFPLTKDAIVIVEKNAAANAVASVNAGNNKESKNVVIAPALPPPPPPPSSSSSSSTTSVAYPLKSRRSLQTNSRYNVDDGELPAPDTVRQVKRIFETGPGRKPSTRRSQSAGPGLSRVPLSAANQTVDKLNVHKLNQVNAKNCSVSSTSSSGAVITSAGSRKQSDTTAPRILDFALDSKPVIIAKPSPIGPKPTVTTPKPAGVLPPSSYTSASSPLPSSTLTITPASTERALQNTIKGSGEPSLQRIAVGGAQGPAVKASPSLVAASIELPKEGLEKEKDEVDRDGGQGIKVISKTALDNIRKESTSVKFNFEDIKDNKLSVLNGPSPLKQVGVIRPQLKTPPAILSVTQDGKPSTKEEPKLSEVKVESPDTPSTIPTTSPKEIILSDQGIQAVKAQAPSPPVATTIAQPSAAVKKPPRVESSKPTINEASSASKSSIVPNEASQSLPAVPQSLPKRVEIASNPPTVATVKIVTPASQPLKVVPGTTKVGGSASDHDATRPARGGALNKDSKKNWHQQSETSTVFNFINDNKVVDHIRNEGGSTGILLYKPNDSGITKLPDYDPGESSDFIDDLDILKRPPSPCNVDFEGGNVIVGKSLIRRRNATTTKSGKLNITFNDAMTKRFEYPSESSFLEEDSTQVSNDTQSETSSLTPLGGVALSNYTPSKVHIETTFELGVSRPIVISTPLPVAPADVTIQSEHIEDYLKPAEEATAWSAETTSDLLF